MISPAAHAARVLSALDCSQTPPPSDEHPHLVWARSGAMSLTGDREPLLISAPLASAARGAWLALASLEKRVQRNVDDNFLPETLLAERAAIAGYTRQGAQSCGGSCRLLPSANGMIALNLARDEDWDLLPALLGIEQLFDRDWQALAEQLQHVDTKTLVGRGHALGLAVADVMTPCPDRPWFIRSVPSQVAAPKTKPLVVDLSALWAGPLCASLLQSAGARVIKVESSQRPDGARLGPAAFFDVMNQGKESLALPLHTPSGWQQLATLLAQADIVIESSRPRALRQMGIHAEDLLTRKPGSVWVSITGYGREPNTELAVAYGDDAGVAAGLSQQIFQSHGRHVFCADAIADPLTGLHAAVAAWAHWQDGRGGLLDISLSAVCRWCREPEVAVTPAYHSADGWRVKIDDSDIPIEAPRARKITRPAAKLGTHNTALLQEFTLAC